MKWSHLVRRFTFLTHHVVSRLALCISEHATDSTVLYWRLALSASPKPWIVPWMHGFKHG